MAPDRGYDGAQDEGDDDALARRPSRSVAQEPIGQEPDAKFLRVRSEQPQFTVRALLIGIVIGILIAFSNTYFGLQTGWISGMAMPSALIGFAYFKGLRALMWKMGDNFKRWGFGENFSEVENVLVQTVAGSVGTMPLGCGFVGVVPALEFLLRPSETPDESVGGFRLPSIGSLTEAYGGLNLPLGSLILWALGLCFFGVVFAVPLRKEVIVREKLRFPSGTATALMIGVLHGGVKSEEEASLEGQWSQRGNAKPQSSVGDEEDQSLLSDAETDESPQVANEQTVDYDQHYEIADNAMKSDWKKEIRLLIYSFLVSGVYTLISYFVPQLHSIPILGNHMSAVWLWNLNPSPAYVGQGIIMGPATTIHMFIGALLGWAVLSPLAKYQGWAVGAVSDWETGSKGWIVWVSLAIMLADAIVSLGWLILRPTIWYSRVYVPAITDIVREKGLSKVLSDLLPESLRGYRSIRLPDDTLTAINTKSSHVEYDQDEEYDAPPHHQIGAKTTVIGLILTLGFCIFAVQYSFSGIISIELTVLALVLATFLSIMAVRALGETDLNPVSGISKLTQLVFALVTPKDSKNAVVINLLAGGISEAGALQAGDLLQDLKCGHLLGASPKAQFYGQLIGSGVGAIVSASVYKLYTKVYKIPGGLFQVPTGFVWVFTARLVTGQGLPDHSPQFAIAAAIIWAVLTAIRIYGQTKRNADGSKGASWVPYVPGGIAVAVGMYNTPSFTLARTVGGLIAWWWTRWLQRDETRVIVLASGLILGEGIVSIINLALASAAIPHL